MNDATMDSTRTGAPALEAETHRDAPLREDIRLLGRVLGDTLREQHGEKTFDLVEHTRRTAIRFRRDRDPSAKRELERMLSGLSHAEIIEVARAYTFFSQLANIAEDLHHNRRRRIDQMEDSPPQEGTMARALGGMLAAGFNGQDLERFLEKSVVTPVLTAHPTEVQRRAVLNRQRDLARLLLERDRLQLTREERAANEDGIRRNVLALWQTRVLRSVRLTVADEIENGLAYYEYTFLRELPRLYADIEDQLASAWPGNGPMLPSMLRVGSWIGGDRDGNPYVTHEVTRHAMKRHATVALDSHLKQIHALGAELSMSRRLVSVSPEVEALAAGSPDKSDHREDEPYRKAITGIYARMAATA
ncbi:MAG: phosphoenolpyruvate carboxylase, partial [Burkholderiales bacterium]